MKICSYVVKYDSGLAPNPFWGYCTLAVCTPNHKGIILGDEDWIIGTEQKHLGSKLIYAMKVAERIHFDRYHRDNRFSRKKPNLSGNWKDKCGDNMYFLGDDKCWKQVPCLYHNIPWEIEKDTKHPYAFISKEFYYFGERSFELPIEFSGLIWQRQGCKCDHSFQLMLAFVKWLQKTYKPGIYGLPRDRHLFMKTSKDMTCSPCNRNSNKRTIQFSKGVKNSKNTIC